MTTFYKATRPDGTDFWTGTVDYGAALLSGEPVMHPNPATDISKKSGARASGYLSVSVEAADCTGFSWPCRLFEVEPAGRAYRDDLHRSKRRVKGLRVVREVPAHLALGPQGQHVAALIEQARALTAGELAARDAARDAAWAAAWAAARAAARVAARVAAWDAAWDAAQGAAWDAAWVAARGAARDAARGAALGLTCRDLISAEQYDALTLPWRTAVGRIHPDDPEVQP